MSDTGIAVTRSCDASCVRCRRHRHRQQPAARWSIAASEHVGLEQTNERKHPIRAPRRPQADDPNSTHPRTQHHAAKPSSRGRVAYYQTTSRYSRTHLAMWMCLRVMKIITTNTKKRPQTGKIYLVEENAKIWVNICNVYLHMYL